MARLGGLDVQVGLRRAGPSGQDQKGRMGRRVVQLGSPGTAASWRLAPF